MFTLEDAWRDNQRSISCIPAGTYEVVAHGWEKDSRVKFKQVWRLLDVPGRSGILIHAGNTHADTSGCILVGLGLAISGDARVTSSKGAIERLRSKLGQGKFTLVIKEEREPPHA